MSDDLIGKWVLLESTVIGSVCGKHPWRVVDVKGKRVYLKEASWVISKGEVVEGDEKFVLKETVKYVFNTQEAAQAAGKASRDISLEWWITQQSGCKADQEAVIGSLGGVPFKEK